MRGGTRPTSREGSLARLGRCCPRKDQVRNPDLKNQLLFAMTENESIVCIRRVAFQGLPSLAVKVGPSKGNLQFRPNTREHSRLLACQRQCILSGRTDKPPDRQPVSSNEFPSEVQICSADVGPLKRVYAKFIRRRMMPPLSFTLEDGAIVFDE